MAASYLEQSVIHLAWNRQIPVWEVASLAGADTLALLGSLQPDLISVACFPYIFPPALLELPRSGCLNLHPSLLPAYRGPDPLFWIARQDERITGVTLHILDRGVDSGDIVAQTRFDRPDGLSGAALERRCAEEGAELLLKALEQLDQSGQLPRHPQPKAGASYFPWPTEADYVIPTHWPARRAFNFIRGAEGWPLAIAVGEKKLPVRSALSYSVEQTLAQPYHIFGNDAWIQFQPGVLRVKIYGS
jgi:methionyl-tRNA formyltransferase